MRSSQPARASPIIDVNGPAHVDALGRAGFAKELLKVIRRLPADGGAVIGLEGAWGSGKTWILDHLDEFNEGLDEGPKVLFYVLAYDPEAAAHALEKALRLRSGEGRRYLEKIVQFAMPVPEVPAFKMQEFAMSKLRRALRDGVEPADENDLTEALGRAAALMRSPRDVVRLETRLALAGPGLVSEISPADVLLAEALNLKVPHVIEYVHRHPREMLTISVEAHDGSRSCGTGVGGDRRYGTKSSSTTAL